MGRFGPLLMLDLRKIFGRRGSAVVAGVMTLLFTADPILFGSIHAALNQQSPSDTLLVTSPSDVPATAAGEKRAKHDELDSSEVVAVVDGATAATRQAASRLTVQFRNLTTFTPIRLILSFALITSSSL